jgi:hypothetical protein
MGGGAAPRPLAGGGVGNFDTSMARTFQFEGGLNKRDTNGTPSNFGINQKANPDVNVLSLTRDSAKPIYKSRYWDTIGADNLPPALAHVAFDTSVIAGPGKARELLAASGGDPMKFMELRTQFLNSLVQRDPAKLDVRRLVRLMVAVAVSGLDGVRDDGINLDACAFVDEIFCGVHGGRPCVVTPSTYHRVKPRQQKNIARR